MTDPSSASRRRRRRSGRHQQPVRRAESTPLSPEEARRNRAAAFGAPNPKRSWPGSVASAAGSSAGSDPAATDSAEPTSGEPSAGGRSSVESTSDGQSPPRPRGRRAAFPLDRIDSPSEQGADGAAAAATGATASSPVEAPVDGAPPPPGRRHAVPTGAADHDAWSGDDAEAGPRQEAGPDSEQKVWPAALAPQAGTSSAVPAEQPSRAASPGEAAASAPSAASSAAEPAAAPAAVRRDGEPGSLPKVAGWTVLTSVLPGSGLLTTRMRRTGVVMLALLALVVVAAVAFLLLGDPLRSGAMLVSRRGVLIGATIVAAVVGLLWALQIVLANLAQTTKERLEGARRYLALALAAVMVVAVAVPFGRGVQSLWALQGLIGSETVFGGREGDHPFTSGPDPWATTERLNILLLGQDSGEDRTGTRPDTIMVASIHPATGQTALFSIPRNLEHVEFPEGTTAAEEFPDGFRYFGRNQDLINAVWTWAEDRPDLFPGDPEPGLTATTWAVEETLGLEMDYYAMVNLKGFEDMVDAIGGVDLVVERRIPIGGGASEVEGYIEPGDQTLDGFHALWYARSREGSNDFNRMCRQQRIVRAVAEEADPTTLALSIPGLVTATEENIQTDIPVANLDAFVDLALRVKDGGFTSYPITQDVTSSADPDWEYLEQWVEASIEDSMKTEPPESVLGETEPGSSEPAATGAAPEEDGGAEQGAAEPTPPQETPTEAESAAGTPSAEESSADGAGEESAAPEPEIEQDPLKSCLPGSAEEG